MMESLNTIKLYSIIGTNNLALVDENNVGNYFERHTVDKWTSKPWVFDEKSKWKLGEERPLSELTAMLTGTFLDMYSGEYNEVSK